MIQNIIVIGGGAAGFFGAIRCAEVNPKSNIIILEQGKNVLNKVRVSGGGRCNVTHACFDPNELCKYYPRGQKELRGPFHRFGPNDTVKWFESNGVRLKTEKDGRMFPVTDDSSTIVNCLIHSAKKYGIQIKTAEKVTDIELNGEKGSHKIITDKGSYEADKLMITTGSSVTIWNLLARKGYKIVPPVPSLFTFNIKDKELQNLSGISVAKSRLRLKGIKIETDGAILITHWGLSGPAILKASAWGALYLYSVGYNFITEIDWAPDYEPEDISALKISNSKKKVQSDYQFGIPSRLWAYLCERAGINEHINWASLSNRQMQNLEIAIKKCEFQVSGKSTFKEEFVTAGGVDLRQIDFRNFESKLHPGVHFAGEVLNIDALTGGFNFQAAWTGGYLAGG